jgi:hypothetical protein
LFSKTQVMAESAVLGCVPVSAMLLGWLAGLLD